MAYPIIDADGHVMERPELFEAYLEKPYQPPASLSMPRPRPATGSSRGS